MADNGRINQGNLKMRIVTAPDGTIQFLPDELPAEAIETISIPNPDNIPGLESADVDSPEVSIGGAPETIDEQEPTHVETKPEVFRVLESYGHLSSEELFALHFNREKQRASLMSDDDLMKSIQELDLIVEIGKIRRRTADVVRLERLESKQKTAKEKQKLKDAGFKIKNRETLNLEKAIKTAEAKPKTRKSDAEVMAAAMMISVEEAQEMIDSKRGKK